MVVLVGESGIAKLRVEVTSASLNQQVQNQSMGSVVTSSKIK